MPNFIPMSVEKIKIVCTKVCSSHSDPTKSLKLSIKSKCFMVDFSMDIEKSYLILLGVSMRWIRTMMKNGKNITFEDATLDFDFP